MTDCADHLALAFPTSAPHRDIADARDAEIAALRLQVAALQAKLALYRKALGRELT